MTLLVLATLSCQTKLPPKAVQNAQTLDYLQRRLRLSEAVLDASALRDYIASTLTRMQWLPLGKRNYYHTYLPTTGPHLPGSAMGPPTIIATSAATPRLADQGSRWLLTHYDDAVAVALALSLLERLPADMPFLVVFLPTADWQSALLYNPIPQMAPWLQHCRGVLSLMHQQDMHPRKELILATRVGSSLYNDWQQQFRRGQLAFSLDTDTRQLPATCDKTAIYSLKSADLGNLEQRITEEVINDLLTFVWQSSVLK